MYSDWLKDAAERYRHSGAISRADDERCYRETRHEQGASFLLDQQLRVEPACRICGHVYAKGDSGPFCWPCFKYRKPCPKYWCGSLVSYFVLVLRRPELAEVREAVQS